MNKPVIAIIAAMQPELETLLAQLQQREDSIVGSVCFYCGILSNQRVVLTLSGIGKVNAAMTTALLIERFNPDYVINTGSAGGLSNNLQVGDVVIGIETAHHDVDVTVFGYVVGQVPQLPARFQADESLLKTAEKAAMAFKNATVHKGLIVSGDQFVGGIAQSNTIKTAFPDVLAVEMEAAAIAQTCFQLKKPFVVIRAISDNGDEKASMSFDEFLQVAGRHSAQMVLNLISSYA